MLRWRLLLGTLLVAALAGLCWLDTHQSLGLPRGCWLYGLAIAVSAAATIELVELFGSLPDARKPSTAIALFGNVLIMFSAAPVLLTTGFDQSDYEILLILAMSASVIIGMAAEIWWYKPAGRSLVRLALTCFGWLYIPVLLTSLVQLRLMYRHGGGDIGMLALVWTVAVVKMGDTGAYTVGRLLGRHKMAPRLSPGKTWEGFAGAIVFSGFASWVVLWIAMRAFGKNIAADGVALMQPRIGWVIYGVVVGIVGLLGDLGESLIKRECGQKNSSRWMPGFGGVLDLLDSILLAAPVALACWGTRIVP